MINETCLNFIHFCLFWSELLNFMSQICVFIILQKMLNNSKKNITVQSKNQSQHSKGIKRSKSTEQLLPKKSVKKPERTPSNEKPEGKHSLSKSKSTKSLKSKAKQVSTFSQCSSKKPKTKKSLKTLKKGREAKENHELSSVLTEQWEVKKPTAEYFIYHNNYIPIENSAQRRLVYKIQMIDLKNNSTTDTFIPTQPRKEDVSIATDPPQCKEIAIGEQLITGSKEVQTEKTKFQEVPEKCFVDVLTELQFLYLPNEDTFAPFSQNERVHYGELLETLAKKMLGEKRAVVAQASLTDEQITVLLYQREGIQVGALEFIPLEGFPTHLLSILAYLKNLFCFLEYGFKDDVLTSLRQFYGLNYNERVRRLSRGLPHEQDDRTVLSPEIFEAFEMQMFKDYEFTSEATKQAVHSHNRAIFDAVNAELQFFRPFFTSQGEPFPWTNNLGMTHYDITQEALYIIFLQVKQKIQRCAITLCGMLTDFDDETLPSPHRSALYRKRMEERQEKMVQEQMKAIDDKVAIDYETSSFYFQLANEVFFALVDEAEADLRRLNGEALEEDQFQFQYFN